MEFKAIDHWPRDRVIRLLKNYAGGGHFSEELLRKLCREASKMLERERGAENIHFAPKSARVVDVSVSYPNIPMPLS